MEDKKDIINIQQNIISPYQLELLTEPTPDYAIRVREDGFRYVKVGYVIDRLNKIFGYDWDFELLPYFNGSVVLITERDGVTNVTVCGQLTIRIRNPKTLEVITTICKTGIGSQDVRRKMEFGDAIKAARSDALKVAARPFIGNDRYWDDLAELEAYERATMPTTIAEMLSRAMSEYGMTASDICELANITEEELFALDEDGIVDIWKSIEQQP